MLLLNECSSGAKNLTSFDLSSKRLVQRTPALRRQRMSLNATACNRSITDYGLSDPSPGCAALGRSIGNACSAFSLALIPRSVSSKILAGLNDGGVERGGNSLNVAANLK